ncbi:hypothetical protein [Brevundimonas sp. NIBR11]|uniref:hypothetical protein n=1 Tax=Brevundimonas sp. NIBR11 TaxID=3015999 RepID=UPI0022F10A89|nr:hypothetical protein [Brevundimonas sp. NIBR11]WGM30432.1 hypothetical protein KKHFBJBL_00655 [Brevundimonas sp. NIBR11]
MDRFEYLIGLVSLIVGLGLADIAISLHRLIKHRSRVRWDGLAMATAAFAAVTMVWIWYNIWSLRDFTGTGGFLFYLTLLIEMFLLFLAAAACLPDESELSEPGGWDLTAYYARSHGYIWTVMALFHASYLIHWIYLGVGYGLTMRLMLEHWAQVLMTLAPVAICAALIFASARRLQWGLLVVLTLVKIAPIWNQTL